MRERPWWILPTIVASQFAGGSLWFAGNAIVADLPPGWSISSGSVGSITSAVQLGFIIGTFLFAAGALADRFSPRLIFFSCALLGAFANLSILLVVHSLTSLLIVRFFVGFFLAGIYPIGMKIAAGWYKGGLGKALGFLVGALVLGTASPHLVRSFDLMAGWQFVIISTSSAAMIGGVLTLVLVPDGPHTTVSSRLNLRALRLIFEVREVRLSAFSYFGHMWELYAFWAFVPFILSAYAAAHLLVTMNVPFWSFCVIAAGTLGCSFGGLVSQRFGSARVAFLQLSLSGLSCLLLPLAFTFGFPIFIVMMIIWGIVVVGDSPQFSAITASYAPKELVGSALTITNCIGFGITIFSIELAGWLTTVVEPSYVTLALSAGPLLGLLFLKPLLRNS